MSTIFIQVRENTETEETFISYAKSGERVPVTITENLTGVRLIDGAEFRVRYATRSDKKKYRGKLINGASLFTLYN